MNCQSCQNLVAATDVFCARCGQPVAAISEADDSRQPVAVVGQLFAGDRYRIVRELGSGGMGAVFEAEDTRLARSVALKVLHPELVAHATARRRMTQEAKALARIEHPNVVRVFDVFDEGAMLVLVLELVTGGDLARKIRQPGMPEAESLRLIGGILAGLGAIHEAGLIHRDLKPGNVLLTKEGLPKITDLGVARDSQARERTQLGATLGTPAYMSPEQVQGATIDARSDLYAAGLLLFELLTGSKPYDADSDFEFAAAHVQQEPKVALLQNKCGTGTKALVSIALAKDPNRRFASAKAMATAADAAMFTRPGAGGLGQAEATGGAGASGAAVFSQSQPAAVNAGWDRAQQMRTESLRMRMNQPVSTIGFFGRVGRPWFFGVAFVPTLLSYQFGEGMAAYADGSTAISAAFLLLALAVIVCGLVMTVRRLHDVDRSGWWALIAFVPYVDVVFLVVLLVAPGTIGLNRFGPPPS